MDGDTKPRAARTGLKKITNCVAWNGEREASSHHGIDADNLTSRVSQWPAGIAGSEPHSGLHPGLRAKRAQRADGVDHSGCQGADKTEGSADGNGKLTRPQLR